MNRHDLQSFFESTSAGYALFPGAALGLYLAPACGYDGFTAAAGFALICAVATALLERFFRPELILAALLPASLLSIAVATQVRFSFAGEVAGGYDLSAIRNALPWVAMVLAITSVVYVRAPNAGRLRARNLLLWAALPVMAAMVGFRYDVHGGRITHAEGTELALTTAADFGRTPYREVDVPPGINYLETATSTKIFGRSLRGLRLWDEMIELVVPGLLVWVAAATLPAHWVAIVALAVMSGVAGASPNAGLVIALLGQLFVVLSIRRHGVVFRRFAFPAGLAVVAACLWLPRVGVPLAIAAAAVFVLGGIYDPSTRPEWRGFTAGLAVALGLASVVLLVSGVGVSFLGSFAPSGPPLIPVFTNGSPIAPTAPMAIVALAVLVAGVVSLGFLVVKGLDGRGRLLLFFWLNASLQAREVLTGAAPERLPELMLAITPVAALLLSMMPKERVLAAVAFAGFLIPMNGRSLVATAFTDAIERQEIPIDELSLLTVPLPGNGHPAPKVDVMIPVAQAQRLAPSAATLQALPLDATIFDFTNHPELYYLADRPPATRTIALRHARSTALQRRVIDRLKASPPDMVLFRSGEGPDPGRSDELVESLLVAEWIVGGYRPATTVGAFMVLKAKSPDPFRNEGTAVYEPIEMRRLPATWAKRYPVEAQEALALETTNTGVWRIALDGIATERPAAFLIEIAATESKRAKLRWTVIANDFEAPSGVDFAVTEIDRGRYLVPLAELPGWVWPGEIRRLELVLDEEAEDVRVTPVSGTLLEIFAR